MHHLLGFSEVVGAAAVNQQVNGLNDDIFTLDAASNYLMPRSLRLFGAYMQSATNDGGRINTPLLRYTTLPRIEPVNVGVLPGDLPPFCDWRRAPLPIDGADVLQVEASDTGAGVRVWAGVWIGDQITPAPGGFATTIQANSTTAATANVWSTVALTFTDALPQGTYDVVGMRVISATGVLARLLPTGGGWRPGCICSATEAEDDLNRFRDGKFGVLTSFNSFTPPGLQVLCTGATAVHRLYLDVVRRGGMGSPVP